MLASSPKRCIYKTCPVGSTLNPTRIFQLSPLAICLQETVLNYFMQIPVHSERFPPTLLSRNSLKHWKVEKKILSLEDKFWATEYTSIVSWSHGRGNGVSSRSPLVQYCLFPQGFSSFIRNHFTRNFLLSTTSINQSITEGFV